MLSSLFSSLYSEMKCLKSIFFFIFFLVKLFGIGGIDRGAEAQIAIPCSSDKFCKSLQPPGSCDACVERLCRCKGEGQGSPGRQVKETIGMNLHV